MSNIIQVLRAIFIGIGFISLTYTVILWYMIGKADVDTTTIPHRANNVPILMVLTAIIMLLIGSLTELIIHFPEPYQPWRSLIFVPAFILNILGLRLLSKACTRTRKDDVSS